MTMADPQAVSGPPPTAVSLGTGLAGVAALVAWLVFASNFSAIAALIGWDGAPARADGPTAALTCVAVVGVAMVLWSVLVDKVHRRASTGLNWSLRRPTADVIDGAAIKLTGLWATWALIALVYMLFRFWWTTRFAAYPFAMAVLGQAAVPLVVLSVPYLIWLERHVVTPRDDLWHFGAMVVGRGDYDRAAVARHLRAWAVKTFFLAFMLAIVPGGYAALVDRPWAFALGDPVQLGNSLTGAMFVVDVQLATAGYILTLRPLDSHIRSAEPTVAGWVAALICYPPTMLMYSGGPLDYHVGDADWAHWLAGRPALLWIWMLALVVLTAIYASATVAFGPRFSNLTNRGILTAGPYRWSRHPAYLAKNLYWWLAGLPFLVTTGSAVDAARNTGIMALVSGVYYWRAKTEERHLRADPTYAAYWQWMEQNAPIPRMLRWAMAQRTRLRAGAAPVR